MTETVERAELTTEESSGVVRWVRLARYSALTIAVWSVALQLLAGELIPPVAVIGIVFAAFVPFLKGDRRLLALVVGVLALVSLLGNLPGTIDELMHPTSAPAFILSSLVTVAAFVAMVAGLAAFRSWSHDTVRAVALSSTGLFIALVVVGVSAASTVESATPFPSDIQVIASGVEFDLTEIVVVPGSNGFWVDNQDGIRHTFTIEGTDMEIDVPGLSAQRANFELAPGAYTVFCAVPGHENMKISLKVEG